MEASFPGRSAQPPAGSKVGMPQSLARHCILPRSASFCSSIPIREPILCSSDNVEDIIQGGIRLRDPYRADRRFHHPGGASSGPLPLDGPRPPAWLAAHGRPQSIDELHQHRAVGYLNHRTGRTIDWLFSPSMKATARSACGRR